MRCVCLRRGSREYEEILNFINEQITPHLRLALRAVGTLPMAASLRGVTSADADVSIVPLRRRGVSPR